MTSNKRHKRNGDFMVKTLYSIPALLASLSVVLAVPQSVQAWGAGHRVITEAALAVQPQELKDRWTPVHQHPVSGEKLSISEWLTVRFTMHPDWVDGPPNDPTKTPERIRSTQFVYAEKDGLFFPPIAYADPDRDPKAPRPKTYHYFTYQQEELNRAFAEKGARWYFDKISDAFRNGENVAAAEYAGAFAHAIEDRVSPYHVWDGYTAEREALESELAAEGLQSEEGSRNGRPANASLFWSLDSGTMDATLTDYQPQSLGATPEEAAKAFTKRLFECREFAKKIYTHREGFLAAHLADDWKTAKTGGQATDDYLSQVAEHNARLVADAFFTAWKLAGN